MAADVAPDSEIADLLRAGRPLTAMPLGRRRLLAEIGFGGAFLAAAIALGVVGDAARDFDAVTTALLVAAFALGIRLPIDVGVSYTSPVQLAFVPMLLLLPTPWVPLLVCIGWLLGRLPDLRGGHMHPTRLLLVPGNCWFALGPALVLVGLDAQLPDWSDWPVYLLALVAQVAFDLAFSALREWRDGIAPERQVRVIAIVQAIDALLAPLGLLAAFAAESWEYAFLLLLPPAGLLVFYAHERARRLANALALADAARDRQELIASASHELVTPLAVLIGLTDRIAPGRPLDDQRREQLHAAMSRELVQLRQLVRQFVDYTRLKTERELRLHPVPVAVGPVAADVAEAFAAIATVEVDAPPDVPQVLADPERVHQVLMGLVANAVQRAPSEPVRLSARRVGDAVEVAASDTGGPLAAADGDPFDERVSLPLHVSREIARAQGGDIAMRSADGGGAVFALTLPVAGARDGAG